MTTKTAVKTSEWVERVRASVPKAVGGAEGDEATVLQAIEELARQDGSVGWNVMIASA